MLAHDIENTPFTVKGVIEHTGPYHYKWSLPEWSIKGGSKLGTVTHDGHPVAIASLSEGGLDRSDSPIHHVRWGNDVTACQKNQH